MLFVRVKLPATRRSDRSLLLYRRDGLLRE
jgi:hypothetical protein